MTVLFLVSTLSVYVGLSFDEKVEMLLPETTLLPSVFNRRASGLSGLFEIAQKAGLPCRPWQNRYAELKNVHGLLVVVEPLKPLTAVETDQILDWVDKGNRLVYFDQFNSAESRQALSKLGLHYASGKKLEEQSVAPCPQARHCSYVEHLVLSTEARLSGGQPIAGDQDGAVLTESKSGKGCALIGTIKGLCANRQLQSPSHFDNFQFLINWLRTSSGAVLFDERCHGYTNTANLFAFLLKQPAGFVFDQILLITIIAVASGAQRFGAVRELQAKREISSLQFIDGLANAYERTKANLAALEIIVQDFKTKLLRELRLSPHSAREEIAHSWQIQTGKDGSNLLAFLADYEQACSEKKLSVPELKKYILKCDQLASELTNLSRFTHRSK